ncbi:Hpt domain-containing protein [Geothrix alkalitolerans]|uniref:Hpt domain-containing protein n=1 Tax=Geothrix alkalitolerans TaxID=2922724 RepID=UPI001FB008D5
MALSDLLDLTTLQNLVELDDGQHGLVVEMIGIFRDDTQGRIEDILAAAGQDDAEAFSRASHALKGGAGALGAKALRALAADLEALGRKGSVEAGPDLRPRLESLFRESLAALEAYVREGQARQG